MVESPFGNGCLLSTGHGGWEWGWEWRTHPEQKFLNEHIWPGSWVGHQDIIFEQREGILGVALPEQAGGSQPPGQTCAMGKGEKSWKWWLWWKRTKARFNGKGEAPVVDTRALETQQGPAPADLQDMTSSNGLLTLGYTGPTPTLTLGCCISVKMPRWMMQNILDLQVWFGREGQMGWWGIPVCISTWLYSLDYKCV